MSSFTDHFFRQTAVECNCGKSKLLIINKMITCPVCGFYHIGSILTIPDREKTPTFVSLPQKAQGFMIDSADEERRHSA